MKVIIEILFGRQIGVTLQAVCIGDGTGQWGRLGILFTDEG